MTTNEDKAVRAVRDMAQAPVAVAGNGVESSTSALSLAAQNIAAPIAPPTEVQPDIPRKERLLAASRSLMEELSGYDLSEVDPAASLMELGLDSLLLTQAAQVFQKKFGVSISFRQLMEELGSLKDIAEYLDAKLATEAFGAPTKAVAAPAAPQVMASTGNSGSANVPASILEQILQQQQQLTQQVLQLMGKAPAAPAASQLPTNAASAPVGQSVPMVIRSEVKSHGRSSPSTARPAWRPRQNRPRRWKR